MWDHEAGSTRCPDTASSWHPRPSFLEELATLFIELQQKHLHFLTLKLHYSLFSWLSEHEPLRAGRIFFAAAPQPLASSGTHLGSQRLLLMNTGPPELQGQNWALGARLQRALLRAPSLGATGGSQGKSLILLLCARPQDRLGPASNSHCRMGWDSARGRLLSSPAFYNPGHHAPLGKPEFGQLPS